MNNKFRTISSIISLFLTTFLLVCIVSAWYVTNEEATADGIVGSTASPEVELYVSTYSLTKEEDTYIKGSQISDMYDYNNFEQDATAVLIVIEYQFNGVDPEKYTLSLNTDIGYVISEDTYKIQDEEDKKEAFQTNYLSNTISFYQDVTAIDDNHFTIDEDATKYSFVSKNESTSKYEKDTNSELDIVSIPINKDTIAMKNYIILDYEDEYINYLYQEMVSQCKNATLNESMTYNEDLFVTLLDQ